MFKKWFLFNIFIFSIIFSNAQTFFSEQEENIVYKSQDIAPSAVCAGDIDSDGDKDILFYFKGIFRLFKHRQDEGTFEESEGFLAPDDWILSVFISDLNSDGKQDIIAASYKNNNIIWYENEGDEKFSQQKTISDSTLGATCIYVADVDNDGYNDVLSASMWDNKIAWYKNDGSGNFGVQQIITTQAEGASYVYVADLDEDELKDVISASIYDNKIAWYKNLGNGVFGEQQIICDSVGRPTSICTADLNNDGYPDILSASEWDNKIAWYQNNDGGNFDEQQVISNTTIGAESIYTADLDNDGDLDVLSASKLDNKIAWFENKGNGYFGNQHVVSVNSEQPGFVYALDVDEDGYRDILSASADGRIVWYENTLLMNIVLNPKNTAVFPGEDVSFQIVADSAKSYQWQSSNGSLFNDLVENNIYSGVNTNKLQITAANFELNKNLYRCISINGNDSLSSDHALLTILDTVNPEFTKIITDTVIPANKSCIAILPDYANLVEVTDNSNGKIHINQKPLPWTKIYEGEQELMLTATDEAGNSSQIKFNVIVSDQIPPAFDNLSTTPELKVNNEGDFYVPDYTNLVPVTDNCSPDSSIIIKQEPAANTILNENQSFVLVSLMAADKSGNKSTYDFEAKILDTIPPEITSIHKDVSIEANFKCQAMMPNYRGKVVANDNLDKSSELFITQTPAPFSIITGDENVVTLAVTDKAKNKTEVTFNIKVKDSESPVIRCIQNQSISLAQGVSVYDVSGNEFDLVSVDDNCEILSIKNNLNGISSLNQYVFPLDTTHVTWTATDKGGNSAQCSFNVIVKKAVGNREIKEKRFTVYPNPTSGLVKFESDNLVNSIGVFDLSGQQIFVKEFMAQMGKIDLSHLPAGNYFLEIETKEKRFNVIILKE